MLRRVSGSGGKAGTPEKGRISDLRGRQGRGKRGPGSISWKKFGHGCGEIAAETSHSGAGAGDRGGFAKVVMGDKAR